MKGKIFGFLAVFLSLSSPLEAQERMEYVRVFCEPQEEKLFISFEMPPISSHMKDDVIRQAPIFIKKYGLYNLRALYKLDENNKLVSKEDYKVFCPLSIGRFELRLSALPPHIKKGDVIDFPKDKIHPLYISLSVDDKILMHDFEVVSADNSKVLNEIDLDLSKKDPEDCLMDISFNWFEPTKGKRFAGSRAFFFNRRNFKPLTEKDDFWRDPYNKLYSGNNL